MQRAALLYVAALALPSASSLVKERIFRDAERDLGRPLDIFVVNTFGSAAQVRSSSAIPLTIRDAIVGAPSSTFV